MKRMTLAGGLLAALATPTLNPVWADGMFWVVGSHAANKCKIVTSNPVVDGADIWFSADPAQFLGRDGSVFDEGDRLGIILHGCGETQRGLPQAPDARLRRQIDLRVIVIPEAARAQIFLERP